jgi:transcriptional regulator with XRE-family HTH domain
VYRIGMTLSDYIRSVGVREFAERFGVTERAALSWLYRQRMPRAAIARRIVKASPVTWSGIYADPPPAEAEEAPANG